MQVCAAAAPANYTRFPTILSSVVITTPMYNQLTDCQSPLSVNSLFIAIGFSFQWATIIMRNSCLGCWEMVAKHPNIQERAGVGQVRVRGATKQSGVSWTPIITSSNSAYKQRICIYKVHFVENIILPELSFSVNAKIALPKVLDCSVGMKWSSNLNSQVLKIDYLYTGLPSIISHQYFPLYSVKKCFWHVYLYTGEIWN